MSEAQQYQEIRRYWKQIRNNEQRRQTKSMLEHNLGKRLDVVLHDGHVFKGRELTEQHKKRIYSSAIASQNRVSEYQCLLNRFKVKEDE